jgi:hypothetical protein
MAENGTYTCAGQPPLVVVDGGEQGNGMHGPWVKYRFPWETDDQAVAVLWLAWDELVAHGYRRAEGEDQ